MNRGEVRHALLAQGSAVEVANPGDPRGALEAVGHLLPSQPATKALLVSARKARVVGDDPDARVAVAQGVGEHAFERGQLALLVEVARLAVHGDEIDELQLTGAQEAIESRYLAQARRIRILRHAHQLR